MKERTGDRGSAVDGAELAAALAGDHHAFQRLTNPYTRELHVHCYRMLGSFHDAEDAVQETLLRAWRHLATFEGRSTFRAWLYRIATNVCLRLGQRRAQPPVAPPALAEAVARSSEPAITLSPYPDTWLDELAATTDDPAAAYDLHESVQLAFLAAVQVLPPRQRAVLILRDVLGWSAAEVAELLEVTPASVNGALNRARTAMEQQRAAGRLQTKRAAPADDEVAQSLARRYVEAWQSVDIGKLVGLLKHDVVMTMPPLPLRYSGRKAVIEFLITIPSSAARDDFRFMPTRANRQPALAAYRLDAEGRAYRAWGMFVLGVDGDAVAEITAFVDPTLASAFGLPSELAWDTDALGQG